MITILDLISAVGPSVGISLGTAAWLSKKLVETSLKKELAEHKKTLEKERDDWLDGLGRKRDEWQAKLRARVDSELAMRAANRDYEFTARKRLDAAIGPLRFQLILACRSTASRIAKFRSYSTSIDNYYGTSLLYRLLRPISISSLVERQMAYADFAVDPSTLEILRFRRAALSAWSGEDVVCDHPKQDWNAQKQHVYNDNVRRVSDALIVKDGVERVQYYSEFCQFVQKSENVERLEPFPTLLDAFTIATKPILWVRLVCFGLVCSQFANSAGKRIGLYETEYPVTKLLADCEDAHIVNNREEYELAIKKTAATTI